MLSLRTMRPDEQRAVRALILAGLADHWGTVDPTLNPDLDDLAASHTGNRTIVAIDGDTLVGTGTIVPRSGGGAEIVRMSVDRSDWFRQATTQLKGTDMLTTDDFWNLVEQARTADDPEQALGDSLATRTAEDVRRFDAVLREMMNNSYTWELWGAGYLMGGGMSDDGFEYFRVWLIFQGRSTFEAVLDDPNHLADVGYIDWLEGPQYVAAEIYDSMTGEGWPDRPKAHDPSGDNWDFDDMAEMKRRYPRLWPISAMDGADA